MFKLAFSLTYLFLSISIANCLETGPFSLREFTKSPLSVEIDGKKKSIIFDQTSKKYGVDYKGEFLWAEYGRPIVLRTQDHKKIQIEFFDQSHMSVQSLDLNNPGVFNFAFYVVNKGEVEKVELTDENIKSDNGPFRSRSIFHDIGLTHIPTVNIFYLPTADRYYKSARAKDADKIFKNYFKEITEEIKNDYVAIQNFCSVKKTYRPSDLNCEKETKALIVGRHLLKESQDYLSYQDCLELKERSSNCVVQALIKNQAKDIPEFLFSKNDVELALNSVKIDCHQEIDVCTLEAKKNFMNSLGLEDKDFILKKLMSLRGLSQKEVLAFNECYDLKMSINGCLVEVESQGLLKYLKNDLTQSPELLSVFEKQIEIQIREGKNPSLQSVLVSGMEKILPEVNWMNESLEIFKRSPSPREAILKFKLVAANHFSSGTKGRVPASYCGIRHGELEKDFNDFLVECHR